MSNDRVSDDDLKVAVEADRVAHEAWLEEKRQKCEELRKQAQAFSKAMGGWVLAEDAEAWHSVCQETAADYHSGRFLIEQMGAERYMNPKLFATLWRLRNDLVTDIGQPSTAEQMLIDLMILGYYNALRVQGWVGDLALQIESEFFDEQGLTVKFEERRGARVAKELKVEDHLRRFQEQLLPVLDRCNRMMIRNLKAIQELRRGPAPSVAIGKAEQVNVAQQQVNSTG